ECSQRDSVLIQVNKKQQGKLIFDKPAICIGEQATYHLVGMDPNDFWFSDYGPRYYIEKWEWKDGTDASSFMNPYGSHYDLGSGGIDGYVLFTTPRKDSIRLITKSRFHDCFDTTAFVAINVRGVTTDFEVVTDNVCFKTPVSLRDKSVATAGNNIVTRTWNFGDGKTFSSTAGGIVNHIYDAPGLYYVSLTIGDDGGCSSSITNTTTPVRTTGAKAAFVFNPAAGITTTTPVNFTSTSNTYYATGTVIYQWNFGDGVTATGTNVAHTYNTAGNYQVRLIAIDQGAACSDTTYQTVYVTLIPPNTVYTTNTTFIGDGNGCPPVDASFVYSSNVISTRLLWSFGDGTTLENVSSPHHIYT
ncbi:MAG: PKD domain-containing protein, partial [Pedobacter sp.]